MTDIYYPSSPSPTPPKTPKDLPPPLSTRMRNPGGYTADPGLADAVNVALLLRQPLLLTGEPGSGKSELAGSVAWELGLAPPLVFEGKSTSQARDLFYTYDTLGRFTAKQLDGPIRPPQDYLTFNALGEAIIRTRAAEELAGIMPTDYQHPGRQRSVVLIDEVEKAPRDFPNDILNEIEKLYFRIPELGNVHIDAAPDLFPVVILTNNSEKSLPDAFLRRCIYYNLPFPDAERLSRIVFNRLGDLYASDPLVKEAISFFLVLRTEGAGLQKRPGTAELLNWLTALHRMGGKSDQPLREQVALATRCFSALSKQADDQPQLLGLFEDWVRVSGNG